MKRHTMKMPQAIALSEWCRNHREQLASGVWTKDEAVSKAALDLKSPDLTEYNMKAVCRAIGFDMKLKRTYKARSGGLKERLCQLEKLVERQEAAMNTMAQQINHIYSRLGEPMTAGLKIRGDR